MSWVAQVIDLANVGFVLTDSEFFGEAADLDRNLLNLLVAAELTAEERAEFERLYRERVDDWRPVLSGPSPATGRLVRPDFGAPPFLVKQAPSEGCRRQLHNILHNILVAFVGRR